MTAHQTVTPRVAIVTGAAQGIGKAIALRLADDGFDVGVAGRNQRTERLDAVVQDIQAKGRRAIALIGDASIEADVVAMVDKTVAELGGLDVMVANAGIIHDPQSVLDLDVDGWDKVQATNVRAVMLCFKHAARQMVKQGRGGRIIGAGSTSSKRGFKGWSPYVASKFAIRGLVQCAALDLREHDITVNSYAAGLIETPMTTHPDDEINGGPCSTFMKRLGLIPEQNPIAQPSVIAGLISYLVRPEAHFVTGRGQCISIDGGVVM